MQNLDKNILIQNIKRLMKEHDVTQPKLADDLHIGQPSISKCLGGKQSITIDLIYSIAQYFNVSIDSLCTAPEEDEPNDRRSRAIRKANYYYETCDALATLFRQHMLTVKEVEINETVYEEERYNENGYCGVEYVRKKGVLGTDFVTNKYNALFYSNYYEVATDFDNDEQYAEYMSELRCCGNELSENIRINKLLNQFSNLYKIYLNGSIPEEAYLHSIDAIVAQAKEQYR